MNARPVYRPDIDGLRAIAVLGVMVYHYGLTTVSGGFTGVDVFFVISGFLITGILRREIEAGEFSLIGFYDRRIRRIAPALFVVLIATLVAGWFLLLPGDYEDMAESAAYSAAGLGNVYFFLNTGYFDQTADLQPLLHMWSLGVEEQFYVVWPLLLFGLMRLIPSRRLLLGVLVACLAAAFAFSVWQVGYDPKSAFYLPHPRSWELAIGAILVLLPAVGSRVLGEIMGAAGLALIGWSYFTLTSEDPFPGINALYACVGAALLIWPKPQTFVASALSLRPIVWIGLISYSLYLWHWPVLVLFRHYANGEVPSVTAAVSLAAVSVVLAYLSWRFVERPFRRPLGSQLRTVGVGVASAAGIVVLSLAVVLTNGFPSRMPPDQAGMAGLDVMWKWKCPRLMPLTAKGKVFVKACNFGVPWETAKTKMVLWGESHAEHMVPILEAAVAGKDVAVVLAYKCAPAVGDPYKFIITDMPTYSKDCATFRNNVLTFLSENKDVSHVVLAGFWASVIGHIFTDEVKTGNNETGIKLVHKSLSEIIAKGAAPNRQFVLVSDVPLFMGTRPALCNTQDSTVILRRPCKGQSKGQDLKTFTAQQGLILDAFHSLKSDSVVTVDPGPPMCASGECMTYLNGEFLYRDVHHLRRNLTPKTLKELADLFGFTAVFASL